MNNKEEIFKINTEEEFNRISLEVFKYQFEINKVYQRFAKCFIQNSDDVKNYFDIPFLPIEFFKKEKIICTDTLPEIVFRSSGTSGIGESCHYVSDLSVYKTSAVKGFEMIYGSLNDYTILALLPSYLERSNSSLVWMIEHFISLSDYKNDCGFFLDDHNTLIKKIKILKDLPSRKVLLLGVSYALLDLAEKINFSLENIIVMETGGMKGKRKEMVREELHEILCEKIGIAAVHSEYGMTEMLSQAYSQGNGKFKCPPWMKILIRETNDPLTFATTGKTGGINIIDLANINSCSFIATQDLGKLHNDETFEVLGRFDSSDVRGCNLMVN
ncbi:MAG TPA: acyltransferase [Bacteroidales bacterium]|nr:acyltransferase [Bacteroidales bacterium]HPS16002.1 acyltransferase [Bacteroidales bacterium]